MTISKRQRAINEKYRMVRQALIKPATPVVGFVISGVSVGGLIPVHDVLCKNCEFVVAFEIMANPKIHHWTIDFETLQTVNIKRKCDYCNKLLAEVVLGEIPKRLDKEICHSSLVTPQKPLNHRPKNKS